MVKIIWTVRAVEHIEEIGQFIEKDSSFQARRVVQLIIKETRKLMQFPRIGKMIPETQADEYREIRIFSYRILYKIIDESNIAIIGVIHGQRLLDIHWLK